MEKEEPPVPFFLPDNKHVLYASTLCYRRFLPAWSDRSHGYLWGVYPSYGSMSDLEGNIVSQLTDNNYYDAEATVSPKRR